MSFFSRSHQECEENKQLPAHQPSILHDSLHSFKPLFFNAQLLPLTILHQTNLYFNPLSSPPFIASFLPSFILETCIFSSRMMMSWPLSISLSFFPSLSLSLLFTSCTLQAVSQSCEAVGSHSLISARSVCCHSLSYNQEKSSFFLQKRS